MKDRLYSTEGKNEYSDSDHNEHDDEFYGSVLPVWRGSDLTFKPRICDPREEFEPLNEEEP